jgi:hypothetical protein
VILSRLRTLTFCVVLYRSEKAILRLRPFYSRSFWIRLHGLQLSVARVPRHGPPRA